MEGRKQAVSLRLNSADIKRIKRLAQRLEARDSDIVRFAIKMMLARIGPLSDPAIRGRNLVPVFAEAGAELVGYFDLDIAQLENIINGGVAEGERMDADDIHLMAMVGTQKAYARVSLRKIVEEKHPHRRQDDLDDSAATSLRRLLYAKYGYEGRSGNGQAGLSTPTPLPRTAELVAQAAARAAPNTSQPQSNPHPQSNSQPQPNPQPHPNTQPNPQPQSQAQPQAPAPSRSAQGEARTARRATGAGARNAQK